MAKIKCDACNQLKATDPNLAVNGWSDSNCTSFKNDTGLVPSSGHNDCTDLELMNDCLIGNMAQETDAYSNCDWKEFAKKFIANLWTILTAIKCAICGIWTNIHNLWTKLNALQDLVNKLQCILAYISEGASFVFSEYTAQSERSYIVAGKGVSFANVGASGTGADITLLYIAGGMGRLNGSCLFYTSNFTDATAVANYDDQGIDPTVTASRQGNSRWSSNGYLGGGGELVYEIRLNKAEFPQILALYGGHAFQRDNGAFHATIIVTTEGHYAQGQHGSCNINTGDPTGTGSDRGHLVPSGWIYIQLRMLYLDEFEATSGGRQYSPYGLVPIKIDTTALGC